MKAIKRHISRFILFAFTALFITGCSSTQGQADINVAQAAGEKYFEAVVSKWDWKTQDNQEWERYCTPQFALVNKERLGAQIDSNHTNNVEVMVAEMDNNRVEFTDFKRVDAKTITGNYHYYQTSVAYIYFPKRNDMSGTIEFKNENGQWLVNSIKQLTSTPIPQ